MWKKLIRKAWKIDDEGKRKGLSKSEVEKFAEKIKEEYGFELPEDYKDFLRFADGFGLDGYYIYGNAEDLEFLSMIEVNKVLRSNEGMERYWFYGTSDMDWYAFDSETGKFLSTGPEGDVYETFDTFTDMLVYVLQECLAEEDEEDDE